MDVYTTSLEGANLDDGKVERETAIEIVWKPGMLKEVMYWINERRKKKDRNLEGNSKNQRQYVKQSSRKPSHARTESHLPVFESWSVGHWPIGSGRHHRVTRGGGLMGSLSM
jgi:hypothetical protein